MYVLRTYVLCMHVYVCKKYNITRTRKSSGFDPKPFDPIAAVSPSIG